MSGHCSKEGCYPEIRCDIGETHKKNCKNWNKKDSSQEISNEGISTSEEDSYLLTWSGNSLGVDDISILSERSNPTLIGTIGAENSGKTTFLGLLYLLLTDGKAIPGWNFSHSYTLLGWEYIARYLRYQAGNKPEFPPHTTSFGGRNVGLLHLGLRKDKLNDVVLTDVPGEWFTNWALDVNNENVGGAPWIHASSRGLFFLIDCEKLVEEPGTGRNETINMIHRLANDLNERPIAVIWSKADLIEDVSEPIKKLIKSELQQFENFREFNVSIYKKGDKNYHKTILEALSWLLNFITEVSTWNSPTVLHTEQEDFFISYRG